MPYSIETGAGEVETITAAVTFTQDVSAGTVTVGVGSYTLPSGTWQAPDVAASFSTDGKTVTVGVTFGNGHLNPTAGLRFWIWLHVVVGAQTLEKKYAYRSFETTGGTAAIGQQSLYPPIQSTPPDHAVVVAWIDSSTVPPVLKGWNGSAWVAIGGSGGTSGFTVVDNLDGTAAVTPLGSATIVDNLDGTVTLTGGTVTDNNDGTLTFA